MSAGRPTNLTEDDLAPLLQATASRSLDTCLRGARGLAVLGDARAFGLLLQLSREEGAWARINTCIALGALNDPRAIKRLRSLLFDPEAGVRDAAFTALAGLHKDDPLSAAESGLGSAFEDVRRRGLQALVAEVRKKPPKKESERSWQLLVRALNDSFPSVRSEAFKAALNLQLAGRGVGTLRFVLQSVHADVRREVLTEVMAKANESWAWNLLLEFFNDHDARLREEAFAFAVKKNKELPPLEAGLLSQYADVRKQAVGGLVRKHTRAAQALLVRALADPDREVRQQALESLVSEDAQAALIEALASPHADVRVRAAGAVARHGSKAALPPLLALATAPEPNEKERQGDWMTLVLAALQGLAELGDVAALPHVTPLLNSKHAAIRKEAAATLAWVCPPNQPEALRQALQHSDPDVKYRAALGLAYASDPMAAALVFSDQAARVLSAGERLVAALTLGPAGEDQLTVFLDEEDENLRNQALILLMLLELKAHGGVPSRCIAGLSSRMPRVRLAGARALETFANPAAFRDLVVAMFNDRGEEPAWKVPAETVETLAILIAHGSPPTRARTAGLLRHLAEKEQAAWDQPWAIHEKRFESEIHKLRQSSAGRASASSRSDAANLRQLAFGAYVGLVREQGGASGGRGSLGPQVVRVRQTALSRILALATADASFQKSALPVFVQALGDPNQAVRLQAFEHLQAIGMDPATLGAEALEAGHTDLGVKGLEVLTAGASSAEGQAVLERVMLTRKDDLAIEAAKLLSAQRGTVAVASRALEAAHEPLRERAVSWLAAEYDKDDTAKGNLRRALESRYQKVRETAAQELATKKDPAAFDALVLQLKEAPDPGRQKAIIHSLVTLGDPRTPNAFLDRLENDPAGNALVDNLLRAAGSFRQPASAERLLLLFEKNDKWRNAAFNALLAVSGYDQSIDDPEEENPDDRWEEKQHPRHDAILARLAERCFALGETRLLKRLLAGLRWARGKEGDAVLALLAAHPDEAIRQQAVEAVGWRLRKRKGPADPLLKLLQHKEPVTQFLAAEGLAKAGRPEGLNVLLAGVDFLADVYLRQRAVRALGELGDVRSLDVLLRLANEDGHALQEEAAEAIGHLGRSAQGEEIFKLLERFAKSESGVAENALKGLRWLNVHAGWQLIRKRAADPTFLWRQTAVEQLGFNDDPATRDLLLNLIAREDVDPDVVEAAVTSARRLWGKSSLEPDYALLQNTEFFDPDQDKDRAALQRVCERGEASRILEILPHCHPDAQEALATSLLNRQPPPTHEAAGAIGGTSEIIVNLAARLLGRAGPAASNAGPALEEALRKWLGQWDERRRALRENSPDVNRLAGIRACLESLLWAAGRLGVAQDVLVTATAARPGDSHYRPIRLAAVAALALAKPSKPVVVALEAAALGDDPEVRTLAAEALARDDARRAAAVAEKLLSDRVSFNRLADQEGVHLEAMLRKAAGQVHYQGVALPHLIAEGDEEGLGAVAADRKLPEATRLGAMEGLALLARETAEERLKRIGLAKGEEEELRKAAWRALRRSKRARQRAAEAKA
jgi:ParB family chromosome partitioning protein